VRGSQKASPSHPPKHAILKRAGQVNSANKHLTIGRQHQLRPPCQAYCDIKKSWNNLIKVPVKYAGHGYKKGTGTMGSWARDSTDTPTYAETTPLLSSRQSDISDNMSKANSEVTSKQASDEQKVIEGSAASSTDGGDEKNPFLDPEVSEYWRLAYEKSQYECRHVFDPNLTWS
jgi:hypothetical protein